MPPKRNGLGLALIGVAWAVVGVASAAYIARHAGDPRAAVTDVGP